MYRKLTDFEIGAASTLEDRFYDTDNAAAELGRVMAKEMRDKTKQVMTSEPSQMFRDHTRYEATLYVFTLDELQALLTQERDKVRYSDDISQLKDE